MGEKGIKRGQLFGFAIASCSHNLHFLDSSEENVISLLPSTGFSFSSVYPSVFHRRHQSFPGPNSVARARARTTFPRNVFSANQPRSCAGVSKEPTFSLNGHDPPPFRHERKSILFRFRLPSLSLSRRNRFDLFPSMLQIPKYFLARY